MAREAPGDGAMAESDPLGAIVRELRKRLLGAPGAGSAAAIVSTLDLGKLGAFEKGTLFGAEQDPATEAVRMAIALRLIAPRARKLSQPLAALGLDLAKLKSERVPELCEKLGRSMSALTSPRDYEHARRIAELRGSLIAAWGEERAVLAVGRPPALRLAATLLNATRRVRGSVRRRVRPTPARKPARKPRRRRRLRVAVLAGAAKLALALGAAILPLALEAALVLELGAAIVR